MQRNLFGVPVPPGAVRVIVRPSLGRGGALPLWEGPLEQGSPPCEADILTAGARNEGFWQYIDAQIRAGRVKPEEVYEWKLRLQFIDQNQAEESAVTSETFEVFRAVAAASSRAPDPSAQLAALHERGFAVLQLIVDKSTATVAEVHKAAAAALSESARAAAGALAEASKQTSQVSELAKALLEETSQLKQAVFELQTERAKGATQTSKSTAGEIKEVLEAGKLLFSLADGMMGKPEGDKPGGSN